MLTKRRLWKRPSGGKAMLTISGKFIFSMGRNRFTEALPARSPARAECRRWERGKRPRTEMRRAAR
jgi:hypothetical protein